VKCSSGGKQCIRGLIAAPCVAAVRRSRDDPPAAPIPRNDADWEVTLARDWWAKTLFGKTFIEARSFFMIYR